MKISRRICSAFVAGLFSLCQGAHSFPTISSITTPSNPTSCTNTSISLLGQWCDNQTYNGSSFSISNDTIFVNITYSSACAGFIINFNRSVNLGNLPIKNYTIIGSAYQGSVLQNSISTTMNVTSCCNFDPTFSASSHLICPGDSVTFNCDSTGADMIDWFVNNLHVSSDTVFTHIFNSPGPNEVRLRLTETGCADSTTQTIDVLSYPNVDLGPDTNFCSGSQVILDAGFGWNMVIWSTGDSSRYTTVDSIGQYVAWVQDGNGCWNSDTINVAEQPLPNADIGNDTVICNGATLLLDATNPGATYLWSDGSTGPTLLVTQAGLYWVTVKVGQCTSNGAISVTYTTCLGISPAAKDKLKLHPNPASDQVTISGLENANFSLFVFNSLGEEIKVGSHINQESMILDASMLAPGLYILRISDGNRNYAKKLIIK